MLHAIVSVNSAISQGLDSAVWTTQNSGSVLMIEWATVHISLYSSNCTKTAELWTSLVVSYFRTTYSDFDRDKWHKAIFRNLAIFYGE